MRISVLASGSRGNCTYIEYKKTKILIDLGVPITYIKRKLKEIDVNICDIDAVILTHTHTDHICGLLGFCKNSLTNIYITAGMEKDIKNITSNYIVATKDYHIINEFLITMIPTSHDTSVSVGFIIKMGKKELVYITDTGYINNNQFSKIENKDIYIFESNHDVEMLMTGKYPYSLKQRILGSIGHLSNKDCSMYLSELVGSKTKCIILVHLSEENNDEGTALNTLLDHLDGVSKKIDRIYIAKQNERTELIRI